jgi:hypothetical protein
MIGSAWQAAFMAERTVVHDKGSRIDFPCLLNTQGRRFVCYGVYLKPKSVMPCVSLGVKPAGHGLS